MSSDLAAFQRIESLTKDALMSFERRDKTLKAMSISEVYPVLRDIADRLMSGPVTEDNRYLLLKDILWVVGQLTLRKTLKKKAGILDKSKKTIQEIESIVVSYLARHELDSLGDQISLGEKTKLENLIIELENAIVQENYSVMAELNENVRTKLAQLMQAPDDQNSESI